MKVVFRVDASLLIGSGHVMRCLVLAEGLSKKGYDISFACTPLDGDMRAFIVARGFEVITLPAPQKVLTPKHDADYIAWLQKSITQDAKDFIAAITTVDLVITDHYAIGVKWQKQVKNSLGCRLLAIDDLARQHQADLILDQTLDREEKDYAISNTRVLVGSEYALLHSNFASKREQAFSRKLTSDQPKILVSMGGIDAPNATLKVLKSLHDKIDAQFTVLLSPRAPHFQQVKEWCLLHSNVTHNEFISDMASLMLEHDIAIGAPGTTSWERACLGLPNIIIPIAENQKFICEQLLKKKASVVVEVVDISHELVNAYQEIVNNWTEFKLANLVICDGAGTRRIIDRIAELEE